MHLLVLFLSELILLFLFSTKLTRLLSSVLFQITKSMRITIYSMALLFFPGTLLHELSHAFIARILFVPVSHIEFFPQLHGQELKMGSVTVAKTDPFRRLLIGTAPFFIGTGAILGILYLTLRYTGFDHPLLLIGITYLIFTISNTLFSSKKDLEGAIEFLLLIVTVIAICYFLGARFPALNTELLSSSPLFTLLEKGALFLAIPLGIDLLIIMMISMVRRLIK